MQATADRGFFVYAADKKEPVVDPSNPRFLQVWTQLAMAYSRTDSLGMLGDVVDREVKRMAIRARNRRQIDRRSTPGFADRTCLPARRR